ncbi:uncharacterized protein SPPG_08444 [Spizellomyces punctatus DAOM BR117]|uniref:Peptidase A1 domain-containing protein n=1 Tax=Spizellomyces punctatus (strain DAOM BR117) TaxID=645134 RepID=A0A0L0H500_SPIPD|nr:uncharacterized protein SPPG_08444 [Spizellomyces punctatus DAOM BR117]KNC96292.1 hypothetical protein SPPG_08444 [Spizellomyces punctatus DAOM BR117]|eukprot:XP_016604332.1 hypothetical protein SPPG_08444 [Spizellomyces punctatus DAOM BR117]
MIFTHFFAIISLVTASVALPAAVPGIITVPLDRVDSTSDLKNAGSFAARAANRYISRSVETRSTLPSKLMPRQVASKEEGFASIFRRQKGDDGINTAKNVNITVLQGGALRMRIDVGTPPRPYGVALDSSSADLWLASPDCKTCVGYEPYVASKSSTGKVSDKKFVVAYNEGSLRVDVTGVTDDLIFGGFPIKQQPFAQADKIPKGFQDVPFDGVLGLAFSAHSEQKAPPLLQSLVDQKVIKSASFALHIPAGKKQATMTIGGIDPTKFSGEIDFVPVDNAAGQWGLNIDQIVAQGKAVDVGTKKGILDTGTSVLLGPMEDVRKVFAAIPGSAEMANGTFTVPCNQDNSFALKLGGKDYGLNGVDFLDEIFSVAGPNNANCVAALSGDQKIKSWVIGTPFLQKFYTVWDLSVPRFGLAKKVE